MTLEHDDADWSAVFVRKLSLAGEMDEPGLRANACHLHDVVEANLLHVNGFFDRPADRCVH
jgi:hypothetical protein